jgi:ABC-type multidrug transport system ATPase subunit
MTRTTDADEPRTASGGLAVRGITVRRAGRTVLDRITFALGPGEIIAVIGANGAGKTTLLEAVVGSVRADSGDVEFQARALRNFAARARVFSFMPDNADPPAEVRVSTLIAYAERFGRVSAERTRHLAERMGLFKLGSARAGELSRGEKRRLSLFTALCTDRPVVVLDEPLGTFDPLQLLDVLEVLHECANAGAALLLSVHQLSDAEKLAGRILILDQGRMVASGTLSEMRSQVARSGASLEEVFLAILEQQHARA